MTIPEPLRSARAWLVWRLIQKPEQKKPSKVPFYASGHPRGWPNGRPVDGRPTDAQPDAGQASPLDRSAMVTMDEARAACVRGGYTGIGFATFDDLGIVALDFDNVVQDGEVRADVLDVVAGSYAELSPSGTGVRAFFKGTLPSRKDTKGDPSIEFFGNTGFVTVTGNVLPGHALFGWGDVVAEVTPAVRNLYVQRFGEPTVDAFSGAPGSDLMAIVPTLGWSLADARAVIMDCDPGADRDHWVKALAALHHEFHGSDDALSLADEWSARGENYGGRADVEGRWRSFGKGRANPITGRWLMKWRDECAVHANLNAQRDTLARATQLIETAVDSLQLKADIARKLQKLLPEDSPALTEIVSAFRDRYKELTDGATLTPTEARALIAPKAAVLPTVKAHLPLTEIGLAARLLARHGQWLKYAFETSQWHAYANGHWRIASDVELEHLAVETVKALHHESNEHPDTAKFYSFCESSQRKKIIDAMIAIARSDPRVVVSIRDFDANPNLVGVQNGIYKIDTGELLAPDPTHLVTKTCGAPYYPDARAPLWVQSLLETFKGDTSMVDFFQRAVGYAICGQPNEDVLLILFGNGANGKSTVLGVVRVALGQYAKAADASSFVTDGKNVASAGGPREDLLRLKGARLVYVNEPDEGGELREGMVKAMTGGDALTVRGLYSKTSVEIVPTWVAFMPTNHLPIIKGSDNGIWRRLMPVPFERNFESDPTIVKDPKREEKLLAELPGVLAWILHGATLYKKIGLAPPDSVKRARDSYRSNMDLLAEWLEECCDIGPAYTCESSLLWQSWEPFARARGITQYIRSSIALGRKLDARFPAAKGTGGVRMRTGLRVRDPFRYSTNGESNDLFRSA